MEMLQVLFGSEDVGHRKNKFMWFLEKSKVLEISH